MKNLIMIVCVAFLSFSVMAQSNDNTKTDIKVNDAENVEFTVKKAEGKSYLNTNLTTIKPAVKIITEAKQEAQKSVSDKEQLKINSKEIKED